MSDYRSEYRAVAREIWWTLPRVVTVATAAILLCAVTIWVFGVLGQPGRIISKTLDADNVITQYEWFRDSWGNVKSKKSQIGQFKGLLKNETDKTESSRLRIELAAIQQSCRDLANRYNANASKINKRIFMGTTVPETIDTGDCE